MMLVAWKVDATLARSIPVNDNGLAWLPTIRLFLSEVVSGVEGRYSSGYGQAVAQNPAAAQSIPGRERWPAS